MEAWMLITGIAHTIIERLHTYLPQVWKGDAAVGTQQNILFTVVQTHLKLPFIFFLFLLQRNTEKTSVQFTLILRCKGQPHSLSFRISNTWHPLTRASGVPCHVPTFPSPMSAAFSPALFVLGLHKATLYLLSRIISSVLYIYIEVLESLSRLIVTPHFHF